MRRQGKGSVAKPRAAARERGGKAAADCIDRRRTREYQAALPLYLPLERERPFDSRIRISDTDREYRYTCTKFSTKVSTVTQVVKLDHVRRPILNMLRILY